MGEKYVLTKCKDTINTCKNKTNKQKKEHVRVTTDL